MKEKEKSVCLENFTWYMTQVLIMNYNLKKIQAVTLQYQSNPTKHQSKSQLNRGFTFGGYLGFTLGSLFENLGPLVVYFGCTWKL